MSAGLVCGGKSTLPGAPAMLRRAGDGAGVHELPGWSHEHELVKEGQGLRMDF